VTVAACLSALRRRSDELSRLIAALSPIEWQSDTNCPPWHVHDLATHLVTSGEGFVRSIRNGLAGSVEPPQHRAAELSAASPTEIAAALGRVTDEFLALYAGLSEAQLETICGHRRGNRSVRWYAAHRLAEVSFHGWDLETSLGRQPHFGGDVARLLLPTLLESNVPRTYAAGLSQERGSGERYLLQVADDPTHASWLVTIDPDALHVTRSDAVADDARADLRIVAPAADLALLVYGRADLSSFRDVQGNRAQVDRFARIFPRP
jgi:uncharacterized protein (TIGR03083 family)